MIQCGAGLARAGSGLLPQQASMRALVMESSTRTSVGFLLCAARIGLSALCLIGLPLQAPPGVPSSQHLICPPELSPYAPECL